MSTSTVAATCRDLMQVYPSAAGPVPALRGIDATFPVGSVTVVIGPSGAGKSTFLRLLACLEQPAAGELQIDGRSTANLSGRARRRLAASKVGYVFQRPADNLLDYLDVREHVNLAARMRSSRDRSVDDLLTTTGLAQVASRRPNDLSAGEQQRLAFAMAVVGQPALVIADEPSAELDPAATDALVALLPRLTARGQTFVISSHDPAVVTIADQLLVIQNGALAARAERAGEAPLAVIDEAGRVQLPDEAVTLFSEGRVRIVIDGGEVRMEAP